MSKIGKLPVPIPKGVKVEQKAHTLTATGPKGTLSVDIHPAISVDIQEKEIVVTRPSDHRTHRSLHGLTRTLIQNLVSGVQEGYVRKLEIIGVGYRAEMKGPVLEVNVGYSHPIYLRPADGIKIEIPPKDNKIIVSGIDKQLVGMTAAEIRSFRPPEPYKGKGIKYIEEVIHRKAGKAAGGGK
jgi:large subunit ribosomal protein L6